MDMGERKDPRFKCLFWQSKLFKHNLLPLKMLAASWYLRALDESEWLPKVTDSWKKVEGGKEKNNSSVSSCKGENSC